MSSPIASLGDQELIDLHHDLTKSITEVRFWLRVTRPKEGCWKWTGFLDAGGYGQFGRNIKAHRRAYEYAIGPIPSGMIVCHSCDNPPCVRPDHLFVGTKMDNSQDMAAKGRAPRAKLSPDKIDRIRQAVAAGANQRKLAGLYGVHPQTISRIVNIHTHRKVR